MNMLSRGRAKSVVGGASMEPIIFFDGVCGLCTRFVYFVLERDGDEFFRFSSLQSAFAKEVLERYGRDTKNIDTVYVLLGQGSSEERLLSRSDASLWVLGHLGGIWRFFFWARFVPKPFRDFIYDRLAQNRYGLFGQMDVCHVPQPQWQERFVENGTAQASD